MTKILTAVVSFLLLVFCSCGNELSEVKQLDTEVRLPVSSTKNVEMLYSDSARLRAKINAPLRDTYIGKDGYIEFPKGVKVEFYNPKSVVESKMRISTRKRES